MRRYDRELSLEIDRTVNRFNAKIKRLERLDRNLELPEPIERTDIVTYKSSKSSIQKRLKEYQKFLERGAEEVIETSAGVRMSRYEYQQIREAQRRAKISLTREINKLSKLTIREFGVDQAGTFATMGDPYYTELVSKRKSVAKDLDKLTRDEIKRKKALINRIKNSQHYQKLYTTNFISILTKLAYLCGVESWKVDLLVEKLKPLTPPQLNELVNRDKGLRTVIEYYIEYFDIISSKRSSKQEDLDNLVDRVDDLYDSLVNNIDEILEGYQPKES